MTLPAFELASQSFDAFEQSPSSALIKNLQQVFRSGQFVHAYILYGPDGVGKRTLANLCVGTLYCRGGGSKPCGVCAECLRIAHGNHPDVFTIRPERSIGVEAIRSLISDIQMRAFGAGYKAVVIEQADRMTHQAQNCLLRTLEDPPPGTVFLLTADSLEAILPTLCSRCRLLAIAPLPDGAVERRLLSQGVPADRAAQLAPLSKGSVGKALRLYQDEGYWPLRERVLRAMFEQTGSAALQSAGEFKEERARGEQVLEIAASAFGDSLRAAYDPSALVGGAYPEAWRAFVRRSPVGAKLRLMECAVRCKKMLASNVSLQAVMETLMINIAEENASCRW